MLDMSPAALAVVQRSFTMDMRAESWLGGQLLADGIPVADGSEDRDRSLSVPERVTLTVPRRDRGTTWSPMRSTDPLAAYGQLLRIGYGVDIGGDFEYINRGWFLITETDTDGDTVSVTAQGLLTYIDEAKLTGPFQPDDGDTFASTVQALVEPALTVVVDGTLIDRAMPLGMQWDDDRMAALSEVLTTWPADATVTDDGLLLVGPVADSGDPVLSLTDGVGGTVVRWQGSGTRDGAYNLVIAQGEDASGNPIQGVAYDTDANSPFAIGGPFSPLPVPNTYYSPLLTTVDQCRASATATLLKGRRTSSRKLTVTTVPHPGLVTGDIVSVTSVEAGLTAAPCVIETQTLPYGPAEMALTVRVL